MATTTQNTQEIETITADELRQILYHIDNQEMTVKELRRLLFGVKNSDREVTINFSMFKVMGVE